jgi:hypothetical protein
MHDRYKQLKHRIAICERRVCAAHKRGLLVSGYFVKLGLARGHLAALVRWRRLEPIISADTAHAWQANHAEFINDMLFDVNSGLGLDVYKAPGDKVGEYHVRRGDIVMASGESLISNIIRTTHVERIPKR